MKTLLLHEKTHARIAAALAPWEHRVRCVATTLDGRLVDALTREEAAKVDPHLAFGSADVWFLPKAQVFMQTVLGATRLEWFQSAAAGVEHPVLSAIGRRAAIYTTCHVQAEAMAEWALWAALDHFRRGPEHRALQADAEWKRLQSREIAGSEWLVIGFGSIGAAIGCRVRALGGRVTGVRRSSGASPDADAMIGSVTPDHLASADVVVLCVPHTPQTEAMADAAFFSAMKADAVFMNLGRGALVNEDHLIAALDAGRPGHAALDVTREEPLPKTHSLWSHPRVTITPHDSAATDATYARADALFIDNLGRWLEGRPMRHVADRSIFGDG
ncbi:D-2-hydroxyacid dehydrogenase [bacterium]|nr:D-2-hydroxyacid dehydrogenase [bacterium]